MSEFDDSYREIVEYLNTIKDRFVQIHLVNTTEGPEIYEHDIKAYCVLGHAAFEQYFEHVALKVAILAITKWHEDRTIKKPLLSLLSYARQRLEVDTEEILRTGTCPRSFDKLRNSIDEAKKQYSDEIYNNHGIDIRYLAKMFIPISIDITDDPTLLSSLKKLATVRGDYAHNRRARTMISPEDAVKCIQDCLKIGNSVRDQANSIS